jgi:hypothetical protein
MSDSTQAKESWYLRAPGASLKSESAGLILQMGAAVNFIRASQRWYLATEDDEGPTGLRNSVCAFLVATAYLKEAIDSILRRKEKLIFDLAKEGGADDELISHVRQLLSTETDSLYSRLLSRLRNKLVFHFDKAPLVEWADQNASGKVTWAEGTGNSEGQVSWGASAEALLNIFPSSNNDSEKLIKEVTDSSRDLTELFQVAMRTYITRNGGVVETEIMK